MPKRRREDQEESIETGNVDQGDFSDGEDDSGEDGEDTDKYRLKSDDIEGQEDPTLEFDGEVKITPFNMEEEMEEGHFDKEGTYIFKKRDKDEIKDSWLDNIDWIKVSNQTAKAKAEEEAIEMEEPVEFNQFACYKEILNLIKPGETVLKALKRLGGNKIQTASERWKKKKQESSGENSADSGNKEQLLKLTELADAILSGTGNMDVYQETFEGIRFKVQQAETPASEKKLEAELDMFGDDFDEQSTKVKRPSTDQDEGPTAKKVRFDSEATEGKETAESTEQTSTDQVQWHFKWENKDTAEVHGPHSSQEMQQWVDQGYFDPGVWVRRVDQSGDFYSSKRIDFEIYL